MVTVRLIEGAYTARSVVASCQRQLNLYSEPNIQGTTTAGYKSGDIEGEKAPMSCYPTPGLRTLVTFPTGPVRGLHLASNGVLFAVSGPSVYAVTTGAWVMSLLGTVTPGLSTPVSMSDNGLEMVIVDGTSSGWKVILSTNVLTPILDATGSFRGADRVDYLDTFFVMNVPGTPQFISSNSLATTFDALYFANKESFSDLLVSVIVSNREIWLLGASTSEVWYNAGSADFPFASMQGAFIDRGCRAKYSVAEMDNAVYWLSADRYGKGIVIQGTGYKATRISTFAIETEMAGYPGIGDAIGYTYSLAGHMFYVLTFPSADKTWCYDISTKLWHELAWIDNNGTEHRHRANCACFAYGIIVAGDWQTGALYQLDLNTYTDAGQPIKRVRVFPHLVADGKRVFYRQFLADLETGNAPQLSIAVQPGASIGPGVLSNVSGPSVTISPGVLSNATAAAGVSLSSPSLSFASTAVGATATTQTVVVTNTGTAALVISGATTTGDFAVTGSTTP